MKPFMDTRDPAKKSFPKKMSIAVSAAVVAAPLLGLSATLYPQETLAKTAHFNKAIFGNKANVGDDIVNTIVVRGEINRNNCLGIQSPVNGTRVIVTPCQDNSNQTSWAFFDGILMNVGVPDHPQCVTVNGNRFAEGAQLVAGSCEDHTVVRWELSGGKFVTHDNLCLDADNGVNTFAVLRGCAAELGGLRDPRRNDQYWDLVPTA
jgi:hypothetical protein